MVKCLLLSWFSLNVLLMEGQYLKCLKVHILHSLHIKANSINMKPKECWSKWSNGKVPGNVSPGPSEASELRKLNFSRTFVMFCSLLSKKTCINLIKYNFSFYLFLCSLFPICLLLYLQYFTIFYTSENKQYVLKYKFS